MASGTMNSARMKENNIQLVFDAIRENEYISRKDLAKKLGLTSATVTNITSHLLRKNYLLESGLEKSNGGRKPIILSINPTAYYVIGVELSSVSIHCVMTDFKARIIQQKQTDFCAAEGKEAIIDKLIATIEAIIAENGLQKEKIAGIGLVTPGPCDFDKGLMVNPPHLTGWHNVPIRDIVESRVGIPVSFEKQTAAAAMCEYWFGEAKHSKVLFLCSILSVGIGSSLLIDGKVFHGFYNSAGEIGHMMIDMNGPRCACGNYGCLETLADGRALVNAVKKKLKTEPDMCERYGVANIEKLTPAEVCARAEAGEKIFMEALLNCARYVGMALSNIVVTISPDTIILAGDIADSSPLFRQEVKRYIYNRAYLEHNNDIKIYNSKFQENLDSVGGVALVFERIFKNM